LGQRATDTTENQVAITRVQADTIQAQKVSDTELLNINSNQQEVIKVVDKHTQDISTL
jgi:hypothetical protein